MLRWLNEILELDNVQYDYTSQEPPTDQHTILRDVVRFEKTTYLQSGRRVYKELQSHYYWYVDNLHFGASAHLEVFDSHGVHVGESNLEGSIDKAKRDPNKRIDV